MQPLNRVEKKAIEHEQQQILQQLEDWLEMPMLVLSFTWLGLFVVELIWERVPLLDAVGILIWGVFILEFILRISLAPRKAAYLKTNWISAIALLLPALRVLRFMRVMRILQTTRAVRGLRLLRVMTRTNRSMRSLSATFARRGFGYVVMMTAIITLVGAAGMYAFEQDAPDLPGFDSYGTALWWTAMLMTTMGSDYFPKTVEGRILCFLLALYAFAVFGYVTATLATFFIGQDADDDEAEIVGAKSIDALRDEITALRTEIQSLRQEN
ncbi:ion transporter [Phormidium tenue]|uniref:Potassium channel protein n=1 Tax=Phormidium tenue NIES-30 TaxID=549789 RepID=A0A1U7J2C8_9CYAN|nr:ion transporter [Phormidium tenue]MBD2233778.1 ion transporter [Phormidium tenue FACHB-1052]OKH46189.1 potassium channel protein [Phormidium tenue NIES-30]